MDNTLPPVPPASLEIRTPVCPGVERAEPSQRPQPPSLPPPPTPPIDPYTPLGEYQGEPAPAPTVPAAGPGLTRLDPLETSESPTKPSLSPAGNEFRRDFDKFMNEQGEPSVLFAPAAYDDQSLSSTFRHSGWMPIRRQVWESLARCNVSPNRRQRFGQCGSYSFVERSNEHPDKFRIRHNHCNDRLCTPCANARSMRLRLSVLDIIQNHGVTFITLTLKGSGEPLSVLLDRLYKHFKALRQHPTWAEKVRGGVAFLEIKYSDKAARWHPHLHILCQAQYLPKTDLFRAWFSISKDSYIVDIQRVRDPVQTGHYVTKYASKPLNTSFSNSPALLDEAVKSLKGRRLCFAFGTWYGKALTDPDLDGDDAMDLIADSWTFFAELEELLARANGGDRDARNIFLSLNAEAAWRSTLTVPA